MKRFGITVLATAVLASAALILHAEEKDASGKGPNVSTEVKKDEKVTGSGVATIDLAMKTAAWARETKNPAGLALAAKILGEVKTQDQPDIKKTEVGDKKGDAPKEATEVTPESLLAEAKAMAGDDAAAKASIESIEKSGATARGATYGAVRHDDVAYGGCYQQFEVAFDAGEIAEVAVSGSGNTDLDLFIYDDNGNLIVSDTSYGDRGYVSFLPFRTSNFYLRVVNQGSYANSYSLYTN